MYDYLIGQITAITADSVTMEVGGVGYHVYVANPYRFPKEPSTQIWVFQSVTQDDLRLYGFLSEDEKQVFQHLIRVSGIGPKSALSILSLGDNQGLVQAIEEGNVTFLTKFPGVGKKTAQRIILDLQGRFTINGDVVFPKVAPIPKEDEERAFVQELREALLSLGYSQREIDRVIRNADFTGVGDTAEAIRVALHFITAS